MMLCNDFRFAPPANASTAAAEHKLPLRGLCFFAIFVATLAAVGVPQTLAAASKNPKYYYRLARGAT